MMLLGLVLSELKAYLRLLAYYRKFLPDPVTVLVSIYAFYAITHHGLGTSRKWKHFEHPSSY